MSFQIFGVSGRIGRGVWWLVQISTIVIGTILNILFDPFAAVNNLQNQEEIQKFFADKQAVAELGRQLLTVAPIYLATTILSHWLFITTSVQRLHDRGNSGWRVLLAYVPMLLIFIALSLVFQGSFWAAGTLALFALAGVVVSFVWMIVEFGMLAGEDCENDYGDPPNASGRKAQLEAELNALRGEPAPDAPAIARTSSYQPTNTAPAMAFNGGSSKPVFGKR
jgi:uncharacterized membrane protein YhaH (DUF805 family)